MQGVEGFLKTGYLKKIVTFTKKPFMRLPQSLLLLLLITSCASVQVNYDYESKTNFSQYKTYNYYSDIDTGLSALDAKRLFGILDAQMQQKGLKLSETPDFYINITSSEYQEAQRNTVGVGLGSVGRNMGGGISIGIPVGQSNVNRQIIFDFVDESGVGLFWQATTASSYNPKATPEKRIAVLKQIVAKALEGFPPKSK